MTKLIGLLFCLFSNLELSRVLATLINVYCEDEHIKFQQIQKEVQYFSSSNFHPDFP